MLPEFARRKFNEVYSIGPEQIDSQFRLDILDYCRGDISKIKAYLFEYGAKSHQMKRGYLGEGKFALSQLLVQVLLYVDCQGYDFDEMLQMGCDSLDGFIERKRKEAEEARTSKRVPE